MIVDKIKKRNIPEKSKKVNIDIPVGKWNIYNNIQRRFKKKLQYLSKLWALFQNAHK